MEKIRYVLLLLSIGFIINFYLISNNYNNTLVMAQMEPVTTLQKVSENGYYLVQFKSGIGPPTPSIPIDIVFLNATSPEDPVSSSDEMNEELAESDLPHPVNYNLAPVKNYDITIYDAQGNILFHKANNDLYGISGKNFVTLEGYKGNITISINNIIMLPSVEKTILERHSSSFSEQATSNNKKLTDSVKFTAFVDTDNTIKVKPSKNLFTIDPN